MWTERSSKKANSVQPYYILTSNKNEIWPGAISALFRIVAWTFFWNSLDNDVFLVHREMFNEFNVLSNKANKGKSGRRRLRLDFFSLPLFLFSDDVFSLHFKKYVNTNFDEIFMYFLQQILTNDVSFLLKTFPSLASVSFILISFPSLPGESRKNSRVHLFRHPFLPQTLNLNKKLKRYTSPFHNSSYIKCLWNTTSLLDP